MTAHVRTNRTERLSPLEAAVGRALPPDAAVLLATDGERELVDLGDRRAWQLPQRPAGQAASDGVSAVERLEAARADGAQFFVVPSSGLEWLERSDELRQHLEAKYRVLFQDKEVGVIYALFDVRPVQPLAGNIAKAKQGKRRRPRRQKLEDHVDGGLLKQLALVFDQDYYSRQAGVPFATAADALAHYLEEGFKAQHDPHPLFDTDYYVRHYLKTPHLETNPLVHFLEHSVEHCHNPNPYFDTAYFYSQVPELREKGANALAHYIVNPASNPSPNPLFGGGYYLTTNADVRGSGMNPLAHYMHIGAHEGRFASRVHERIAADIARSSRGGLLRGRWQRGRVLAFSRGESPEASLLEVADFLVSDYHLNPLVVMFKRPSRNDEAGKYIAQLALEDYREACEILRPSALRLLARSLTVTNPLFALSDADEVLGTLRTAGVPTYFLYPSGATTPLGDGVREAVAEATRIVFPSSESFHSAAEAIGSYPVNVALRPGTSLSQQPDGPDDPESSKKYAQFLIDLARRDGGLDKARWQPNEKARQSTASRRVVIACSDWGVSGVNASLEAVGLELQRRGWDVEIVFTRDRATVIRSAGDEEHLPRLPYTYLEAEAPGTEGMWRGLIAHLEASAPCILFMAYDFIGNSVAPSLTSDVGVVMWAQADDGDYYEQAHRLGRYCNAIVCVSTSIRDNIAALNPTIGQRAHVIYNASMRDDEVLTTRREPVDKLRIVYTGRLVRYQKRVFDYIELARALDERGAPYVMTLIGAFSSRDNTSEVFHDLAKAHLEDGRIRLPGRMSRSDLLDELSNHDFFVLLSDFEGLPLALVEGMARGCVPIVAEAESGIPEIVTNGENGMVVSGRDYGKWADLLLELWRDGERYSQMAETAAETVRAKFTVERVAGKFDELFASVAAEVAGDWTRPPSLNWGPERSLTGDVLPPPSLYRPIKALRLQ